MAQTGASPRDLRLAAVWRALRGELDLPQADVGGRDLDALVLADVLERLVERERARRNEPNELVGGRRARVFVSFFSFVAFTSRSSPRAFSPTIIPS